MAAQIADLLYPNDRSELTEKTSDLCDLICRTHTDLIDIFANKKSETEKAEEAAQVFMKAATELLYRFEKDKNERDNQPEREDAKSEPIREGR